MTEYIKPDDQIQYGPEELSGVPDILFNGYEGFFNSNTDAQEEWKDFTNPSFWIPNEYSPGTGYNGLLWSGVDWVTHKYFSEMRNYLLVLGNWAERIQIYGIRITFVCASPVITYVTFALGSPYIIDPITSGDTFPILSNRASLTGLLFDAGEDTLHITKIEIRQIPISP